MPSRPTQRGKAAALRLKSQVRDALGSLFDQESPFGRLALTHVLMTSGDTLLTVSLAGSLFFSISPSEAKSRVLLYLLLTIAPFAVVAPLLGPAIDRSRGARRAMVVASAVCRAAVCVVLAGKLHSLLLFPLAFLMLVLSKLYLVTKGAIVPLLAGDGDGEEMAALNARLGLLASLAGFAASVPAICVLKLLGSAWVVRLDVVVFAAATVFALRLPVPDRRGSRRRAPGQAGGGATAQGPTAGPGRPTDTAPAVPVPSSARVEPVTTGAVAAGQAATGPGLEPYEPTSAVAALGGRFAWHPQLTLALSAMSVLKAVTGFLTFLLAFDLRRKGVALAWYGVVLAASVAGSIVGVLLVPRLRRHLSEPQMLVCALWVVVLGAGVAAAQGGIAIQALAALAVGTAGAAAKPAFDALVQRHVPPDQQGRTFARFETRFQLFWVVGALIPVAVKIPLTPGDIVMAAVCGVAAVFYLTGRRALRQRPLRPGNPIGDRRPGAVAGRGSRQPPARSPGGG